MSRALEAVVAAEESVDPIRIAYATAYAAHALLLESEVDAARKHVERSLAVLSPVLVLLPWPLAMLAEIECRCGNLDIAADIAARAEAISATTGVAYQRGLALRSLALVDAARGDHDAAVDRLTTALAHARHTTGEGYAFHWPIAWILESLAQVSARTDPEASQRWAEAMLAHTTTVGMDTFIRRGENVLAGRTSD